eukprot:1004439_1
MNTSLSNCSTVTLLEPDTSPESSPSKLNLLASPPSSPTHVHQHSISSGESENQTMDMNSELNDTSSQPDLQAEEPAQEHLVPEEQAVLSQNEEPALEEQEPAFDEQPAFEEQPVSQEPACGDSDFACSSQEDGMDIDICGDEENPLKAQSNAPNSSPVHFGPSTPSNAFKQMRLSSVSHQPWMQPGALQSGAIPRNESVYETRPNTNSHPEFTARIQRHNNFASQPKSYCFPMQSNDFDPQSNSFPSQSNYITSQSNHIPMQSNRLPLQSNRLPTQSPLAVSDCDDRDSIISAVGMCGNSGNTEQKIQSAPSGRCHCCKQKMPQSSHSSQKEKKQFSCPYCARVFVRQGNLDNHIQSKHAQWLQLQRAHAQDSMRMHQIHSNFPLILPRPGQFSYSP